MVIKVGINGFGRIGRIIFRKTAQNKDLQVAAINDPAVDIDYICYLIKYDSTHGKFKKKIMFAGNEIIIDDTKIKVFHEKSPLNIPWQAAGVQYVVEASGMFTNLERASGHLASETIKRVIVTAPSGDIPMMILGVNEDKVSSEQRVISSASSTLYCLAPLIKVLEDNYGVSEGFITSIHAMTPSLKPLDGLCLRGKHWRDHRSIHQNIIPATTGACKALGKIIPQVKDKMTGLAFRVPIVNVSVLDVTIRLNKNTTIEDIIKRIHKESQSTMKNIINTSSDEAVSSDFLGATNSCVLDENSSLQLTPNFFKLICWYENEYSYACRVVDSIMYSETCLHLEFISKIRNRLFLSNKLFQERNKINQMFVKTSYNIQNKAKVLLSTSQDNEIKTKFSNQQLKNKRAFTHSDLPEEKSKNDIFQIWNDEIKVGKPRVKENIEPFYHSCVTLTAPTKRLNCSKTRECIENDKTEFIKTLHKKENLTQKSSQKKYQDDNLEVGINKENIEDLKLNTICKNSPMCCDYVSCDSKLYNYLLETKNMRKKHKILSSEISNKINLNEIELKSEKQSINSYYTEEENVFNQSLISVTDNNKQSTQTLDNTLDTRQLLLIDNDDQENANSQSINPQTSIINSEGPRFLSNLNDLNSIINYKDNQNNITRNKEQDHGVDYSKEIGVVKTFEPCKSYFNQISNDNSVFESNTSSADHRTASLKEDLQKNIVKGIINTYSVGMALVDTGSQNLRAVTTNTSISNDERGTLSDIYDKLDSASGTDSENSFQIKERKSQVLNIADLTTSVENLARLDKICKIIEISDELSDKLFSVLDNNNQDFERNNWSFKDLCERLKLDEFCNHVFGELKF